MKFLVFAALVIASASADITKLTQEEVDLVKSSWKNVAADLSGAAETIFYNYLSKYPSNQDQFATLKGKPLNDIRSTPNFKLIAGRILNVFNNVVSSITYDLAQKDFQQIVVDVARPHVARPISQKAYNELRGVIVEYLNLDAPSTVAWTKLLDDFYFVFFETLAGRGAQFV